MAGNKKKHRKRIKSRFRILPRTPVPLVGEGDREAFFTHYQVLAEAVGRAELELTCAKDALSEHVQAMHTTLGTGPFLWRGQMLKLLHRNGTYYARTTKA